jgi:hypothetical protein
MVASFASGFAKRIKLANSRQFAAQSKQKRRAFTRRLVSMDCRIKPGNDDLRTCSMLSS